MIIRKIAILKWLFLPVILCVRLIVIQTEELLLIPLFVMYSTFCKNYQESDKKRNTIVDYKVRMNN